MRLDFIPFPILTTERLILRQMNLHDDNEIYFLRSDERTLHNTGVPKAGSINDAREFIKRIDSLIANNESILWAINLKNSTKAIGTICIWNISRENSKAEVGYVLHPAHQGQGIMQEALVKIIDYGFSIMQLKSIEAHVHPDNSRSIKLLERNGFNLNSISTDTLIYSLQNLKNKIL